MVKSVLGVNHRGLRDWLFQRITAVVMAVYSAALMGYFLTHGTVDFADWHFLCSHLWMKIATILFVVSLLYHAWIGMWTIITDYFKPFLLALIAHIVVFFTLASCFFWALEILWGI